MQIPSDEEQLDWMGSDCWFCGQRPPAAGKSSQVKLKKFTDGPGGSVAVLRSSVSVPRCEPCYAAHLQGALRQGWASCGGAALVFLVVVVWSPIELEGGLKALLVFLGLLPGPLLFGGSGSLPPGQKPESEAEAFRAVQALKDGGWLKDS